MKIAVFYHLPPGGALRVAYEQVKYLSKNHQVDTYEIVSNKTTFLNPAKNSSSHNQYKFNIDNRMPGFLNRLLRDIKTFIVLPLVHYKIAADINKGGYDLVLIHPDKYTESPFILNFIQTKKVYYCHELLRIGYEKSLEFTEDVIFFKRIYELTTRKIRKWIDKNNASQADLILTNSKYIKRKVDEEYKVPSLVCYPGVDTNIFRPYKVNKNYFLFNGSKLKIDGWDLLSESLNGINTKPTIKVLEFKNNKAPIEDDVRLAKIYSGAIATLCLDREEPFGLKVLESSACGTPVIAVSEGGYIENVKEGVNGYLIKRDPKELQEKMNLLTNYKTTILEKSSRKEALNWSWEKSGKTLEDMLYKITK